jgi:hypothetical protein
MFKKPFNRTIGEERTCKGCGVSFYTFKPRYSCNACLNIKQKVIEERKRAKYAKKSRYPFDTTNNTAGARFCRIHRELVIAWKQYKETNNREYLTEHYEKQLKEIEENGILNWIKDRRDAETLSAKKTKSKDNIRKDYPNTHDYYEY